MKRGVVKRSVTVGVSKTSVTLEEPFWNLLKEYATRDDMTVGQYLSQINAGRDRDAYENFSSYVRVCLLQRLQLELHQALLVKDAQRASPEPFPSSAMASS